MNIDPMRPFKRPADSESGPRGRYADEPNWLHTGEFLVSGCAYHPGPPLRPLGFWLRFMTGIAERLSRGASTIYAYVEKHR